MALTQINTVKEERSRASDPELRQNWIIGETPRNRYQRVEKALTALENDERSVDVAKSTPLGEKVFDVLKLGLRSTYACETFGDFDIRKVEHKGHVYEVIGNAVDSTKDFTTYSFGIRIDNSSPLMVRITATPETVIAPQTMDSGVMFTIFDQGNVIFAANSIQSGDSEIKAGVTFPIMSTNEFLHASPAEFYTLLLKSLLQQYDAYGNQVKGFKTMYKIINEARKRAEEFESLSSRHVYRGILGTTLLCEDPAKNLNVVQITDDEHRHGFYHIELRNSGFILGNLFVDIAKSLGIVIRPEDIQ